MMRRRWRWLVLGVLWVALPEIAVAQGAAGDLSLNVSLEGRNFSKAVNILLLLTALSVAPSFIMMMTSFTRIVIVLAFLKQALGIQQGLSPRTNASLALFLTIFIMQPVWHDIYQNAVVPYSNKTMDETTAIREAAKPIKAFMLKHTRENSLLLFMELSGTEPVANMDELPMRVMVPAFMLSELKTAFQMAFLLYLPFLVIDVVVATILMSMGMIMLPPMMISLPFKLLLFIMFDGWDLLLRALVVSFY